MNENQITAADLLRTASVEADLDVEALRDFGTPTLSGEINALRAGDQVFTMGDGTDEDGSPFPGYAYTWGSVTEDGEYVDESDAQWADTADEAKAAIEKWLARRS